MPGTAEEAVTGSDPPVTGPNPTAGRPRRFGTEDELRLLLDAALVVMERNGYADAAVADILRQANLSTRSFYRHFASKDELVCALFRREAEEAAARLCTEVGAAADPLAGLHAWVDVILSFGFDQTKAAQVSVLRSEGAMKAEGYTEEARRVRALLMAPLEAVLAAGATDGTFRLVDPDSDARLVQAVVWSAAGLDPSRDRIEPQDEAARQVRSFCERALGVSGLAGGAAGRRRADSR